MVGFLFFRFIAGELATLRHPLPQAPASRWTRLIPPRHSLLGSANELDGIVDTLYVSTFQLQCQNRRRESHRRSGWRIGQCRSEQAAAWVVMPSLLLTASLEAHRNAIESNMTGQIKRGVNRQQKGRKARVNAGKSRGRFSDDGQTPIISWSAALFYSIFIG